MARAKHRDQIKHNEYVAFCKKVENERKQQEMREAHKKYQKGNIRES